MLAQADTGMLPEPSRMTVKECIATWLDGAHGLAPKTVERYWQLAEQQIYPHLGTSVLQKLKPAKVQEWPGILFKSGGKDGKPLSAQTVTHANRVLHRALERGVENETWLAMLPPSSARRRSRRRRSRSSAQRRWAQL